MNENTKEFRLRDYISVFEKSLNYLTGAVLAIFIAGMSWYIVSEPNWKMMLPQKLHSIHDNPKELLCLIVAVLSMLPYFFYYSLKDNIGWNACNGSRDNLGLGKICVLYEICIMSFFYLLLQGQVQFAGSKLIISIVNIILIILYCIFLKEGKKKGENIGYFLAIIILAFIFFGGLFVNSLLNLQKHFRNQNYAIIEFMGLFLLNAGVNIFFLFRCDSSEETGIISNRIKIMIPVISISIYTVSMVYCFYYFNGNLLIMLFVALWITSYEIIISCFKFYNENIKMFWCVIAFIIFIFGIPIAIWFKKIPSELNLYWLILVGISIYMAAIKYWGYILKFLFGEKRKKESKARIMGIMIWFRNSTLGSMLFTLVVILANQRYYTLLITIIAGSLITEIFIYKLLFNGLDKNVGKKIYSIGRIIEFSAILLPLIVYIIENIFNFDLDSYFKCKKEIPVASIVLGVVLCFVVLCIYILYKLKGKEQLKLPETGLRQAIKELLKYLWDIRLISKKRLPDKNFRNFWIIIISWCFYITLTTFFMCTIPSISNYRTWGIILMCVIIGGDWMALSRNLLNYYIDRMEDGRSIVDFLDAFNKEWEKCLDELGDFKEKDAKQFQLGNRLRPILFFLGSSYQCYDSIEEKFYNDVARASCSLELIHKSSVIFDDYIDQDEQRNGKQTFHKQYPDINTLILLGNAMIAKAQMNFAECRSIFKCNENVLTDNMKKLSKITYDLCLGCYRELERADYDRQNLDEIDDIIFLETVSLIKESMGLGYSCFHKEQGNREYENIEKLGESFGYIFQYLNDLEPFSQKELYEKHKGEIDNFDYGRKNIALFALYNKISEEEKNYFDKNNYEKILQMYQKYNIEQEILNKAKEKVSEIEEILDALKAGNLEWVKAFKALFNFALERKRWEEKIPKL